MGFVVFILLDFLLDLFLAWLLMLLFGIIGIPFLDALSYWQCYGVMVAFALIQASSRIASASD